MAVAKPFVSLVIRKRRKHCTDSVYGISREPQRHRSPDSCIPMMARSREPNQSANCLFYTFLTLYSFLLRSTQKSVVKSFTENRNVCQHKFNMYDSLPASLQWYRGCVRVCVQIRRTYGKINAAHHIECNAKHSPTGDWTRYDKYAAAVCTTVDTSKYIIRDSVLGHIPFSKSKQKKKEKLFSLVQPFKCAYIKTS